MEITGAVLTSLFVGMAWALIKTVQFFINKYGNLNSPNQLTPEQMIKEIHDKIMVISDNKLAGKEQEEILGDIYKKTNELYNLHKVYDNNHVPAWYFPAEALPLIRESSNVLNTLTKRIDEMSDEMKTTHLININRMNDLISSQKAMTERLGDLIMALNKFYK